MNDFLVADEQLISVDSITNFYRPLDEYQKCHHCNHFYKEIKPAKFRFFCVFFFFLMENVAWFLRFCQFFVITVKIVDICNHTFLFITLLEPKFDYSVFIIFLLFSNHIECKFSSVTFSSYLFIVKFMFDYFTINFFIYDMLTYFFSVRGKFVKIDFTYL